MRQNGIIFLSWKSWTPWWLGGGGSWTVLFYLDAIQLVIQLHEMTWNEPVEKLSGEQDLWVIKACIGETSGERCHTYCSYGRRKRAEIQGSKPQETLILGLWYFLYTAQRVGKEVWEVVILTYDWQSGVGVIYCGRPTNPKIPSLYSILYFGNTAHYISIIYTVLSWPFLMLTIPQISYSYKRSLQPEAKHVSLTKICSLSQVMSNCLLEEVKKDKR